MNSNLYHSISNESFSRQFTFFDYNIDMAMREEKFEATKWIKRSDKVAKLINSYSPDIICLQELRELPDNDTPKTFLAKNFPTYDYYLARRNASKLAFGQATLWNPEKFFCVEQKCFWLSENETIVSDSWGAAAGGTTGFGYIMTATKLNYVHSENNQQKIIKLEDDEDIAFSRQNLVPVNDEELIPVLWIFNVHLGLEEYLKTKSCEKIVELVRSVTNDHSDNFILCGDFNMFPDKDGMKQYEILTKNKYSMNPVFDYQKLTSRFGLDLYGTFVGYRHDAFCAKEPLKQMSHLDHVFINKYNNNNKLKVLDKNVVITNNCLQIDDERDALLNPDTMPSDHLALMVLFESYF